MHLQFPLDSSDLHHLTDLANVIPQIENAQIRGFITGTLNSRFVIVRF